MDPGPPPDGPFLAEPAPLRPAGRGEGTEPAGAGDETGHETGHETGAWGPTGRRLYRILKAELGTLLPRSVDR